MQYLNQGPYPLPTQPSETMLLSGLMARFNTGNPIMDPVIHMVIYSIVGVILLNIKTILDLANIRYYFNYWFGPILTPVSDGIKKILRRDPKFIDKVAIISSISENHKVNNLYKAVEWYLSNKCTVDLIRETPLNMAYEDDIEYPKPGITTKVNKRITQNKYKSLKYNDHEIFYIIDKSLITVYADKERKRENFTITLSTKMNKNSEVDILEDFTQYCLDEYIKSRRPDIWTQKIYVNNTSGEWVSQDSNNKRKLDTVILKEGQLDDIKNDIESFLKSEQWYNDRDIPYTRGYLLYGSPGTGKTSFIKGASNLAKRHLHYLMLNNVQSDSQLLSLLGKIKYDETILVTEDIDCMTKIIEDRNKDKSKEKKEEDIDKLIDEKLKEKMGQQKNSDTSNTLTLSGLLNALDGIFNNNGRILIMTTNHPEKLDPALIRPGRIDRKVSFSKCDFYQIKEIYKMMYDTTEIPEKLKEIKENKYSPAEITSLFLRYRTDSTKALENIHELDEQQNFIIERKFFGKEMEKLMTEEKKQENNQMGFMPMNGAVGGKFMNSPGYTAL